MVFIQVRDVFEYGHISRQQEYIYIYIYIYIYPKIKAKSSPKTKTKKEIYPKVKPKSATKVKQELIASKPPPFIIGDYEEIAKKR